MFCHKCGSRLVAGSQFCHGCGTRVAGSEGSAAPDREEQPPSRSAPRPTAAAAAPAQAQITRTPAAQAQQLPAQPGLSVPGIWSIICSIAAVFLVPPLFGAAAVYLGYRAKKSGDRAGDALMIGAVVATIAGMIFGAIFWTQVVQ